MNDAEVKTTPNSATPDDARPDAPAGAAVAPGADPAPRPAALSWLGRFPHAGWIALAVLATAAFFYLLAPILTPFALAGVLAYMLAPGVNWLERHHLPRALASVVMVVLSGAILIGLMLVLLPVLQHEAVALKSRLPALVALGNARIAPLLQQWLGVSVHLDTSVLRELAVQQVGQQDAASSLLARFGSGGLALVEALGSLMLIPVVLFYLLLDSRALTGRLESALPRRWHAHTMGFLGEIDSVLAQFLRGQLTVMLVLAVYYSAALAIAGFESALPIGVLTGLLIFIPYVGFVLGLVLAALAALLQFGTWQAGLVVLAIYGIGQVLEGFFLTPRLVGSRIGLHPLAVIFALLAFGHVFGFFGVLVALPSSAVLLVALRHLRTRYLDSAFYRDA